MRSRSNAILGIRFQHAAARRRLELVLACVQLGTGFQHAAARRRLGLSRLLQKTKGCFNTQPPEGGWGGADYGFGDFMVSTRSRPKAAGR